MSVDDLQEKVRSRHPSDNSNYPSLLGHLGLRRARRCLATNPRCSLRRRDLATTTRHPRCHAGVCLETTNLQDFRLSEHTVKPNRKLAAVFPRRDSLQTSTTSLNMTKSTASWNPTTKNDVRCSPRYRTTLYPIIVPITMQHKIQV